MRHSPKPPNGNTRTLQSPAHQPFPSTRLPPLGSGHLGGGGPCERSRCRTAPAVRSLVDRPRDPASPTLAPALHTPPRTHIPNTAIVRFSRLRQAREWVMERASATPRTTCPVERPTPRESGGYAVMLASLQPTIANLARKSRRIESLSDVPGG
jgi:hypothetical protein